MFGGDTAALYGMPQDGHKHFIDFCLATPRRVVYLTLADKGDGAIESWGAPIIRNLAIGGVVESTRVGYMLHFVEFAKYS